MDRGQIANLIAVVLIGCVHALVGRTTVRAPIKERVLSAASGISTAYVFVTLFPELANFQAEFLKKHPHRPLVWLHEQVFLLALLGFLTLTGLKRWAHQKEIREPSHIGSFALALGSSFLVNGAIGYTLAELGVMRGLALASVAYGAHLLVDDAQLHRRWPARFANAGRWMLMAALLWGWLMRAGDLSRGHVLAIGYALLSGNIMADALPHEAGNEPRMHYRTFVLGALAFTALVLTTYWLERG